MRRIVVANARVGGWWWRLPLLAVIWLAFAVPTVAGLVVVHELRSWAEQIPAVPDLEAWRSHAPQTSLILAADGSHLAEVPFVDGPVVGHRTLVPLEAVPRVLVQAVLAAEDVRFLRHHGVDWQAVARAAYENYKAGRVVEGASTITQQLARNLLPVEIGTERSVKRKFREAMLAREVEKRWSKQQILETYLSYVFLGQGAYGVEAAARAYFDREVGGIDLARAALLAGMIQAPARLDPYRHPVAAKARRDEILARMTRAGFIGESTRAATVALPITLARPHPSYGTRVPWYTEQVRALIASAIPGELARGGLTIETAALPALGTELQADALAQSERWNHAQVSAMVWDHQTGYVEAIVGGREWDPDRFDRLLLSCRQPGSAWKPVVYGAALVANAITPGTPLRDAPITDYDEATNVFWRPRSGHQFRGIALAQDAFAASLNAPAIDVFERVGAAAVIALARRLGITTPLTDLRPMALGASCVKPIELARAYAVVAHGGWAIAPRFAVRVRRGEDVLFDASVPEDPWLDAAHRFDREAALAGTAPDVRVGAQGGQLLDAGVAYQLTDMMGAVIARGTATAAKAIERPAAGKTGTTNDNTDAWFVGFTGRVLAAVWLGFDDPSRKLGHEGDGAHAAVPLWSKAIRAAEGARPRAAVPGQPPPGLERVAIDRASGLRSGGGLAVWFRAGTVPPDTAGQAGTSATDFGQATRSF